MLTSGTACVAEPEPVLFGRSRCKDVKAKICFLLLFSLFLYEKEPEPEPVKKKYLEPEPVKKGPAPQHCFYLYPTMIRYLAQFINSMAD